MGGVVCCCLPISLILSLSYCSIVIHFVSSFLFFFFLLFAFGLSLDTFKRALLRATAVRVASLIELSRILPHFLFTTVHLRSLRSHLRREPCCSLCGLAGRLRQN